jgi:hypothetical protein
MNSIICKSTYNIYIYKYQYCACAAVLLVGILRCYCLLRRCNVLKLTPLHSDIITHNCCSALQTFRKETDDGDELELHGGEVASLMNLVATDTQVEEAVALIPSLSRFPEAAIDEILDLIRSTMIRITS